MKIAIPLIVLALFASGCEQQNIRSGTSNESEKTVSLRGYSSDGTRNQDPYEEDKGFELENIAKTDVDMVAELHLNQSLMDLRALMGKLYRRNPAEFRKSLAVDVEARKKQIFNDHDFSNLPGLNGARGIDAIRLTFDKDFTGDRVLALTGGLADMLIASFGGKHEFFFVDKLEGQNLYNSARNIEIAVWRLSNTFDEDGKLFLLSNSGVEDDVANLSFERLFGKLIARQDMIAQIVSDKNDRAIKSVIQSIASAFFIPIP